MLFQHLSSAVQVLIKPFPTGIITFLDARHVAHDGNCEEFVTGGKGYHVCKLGDGECEKIWLCMSDLGDAA